MTADRHHPTRRPRIHEHVIQVLLKKIFRGEVAVGDKLPTERALAGSFGVNRATVREALRHLETLELVAIRQGDGAYVRNFLESGNLEVVKAMSRVDVTLRREVLTALMEVRRNNLPAVAYTAALKRSARQLERLAETAFNRSDMDIMERDKTVHHIIGLASGNILNVLLINFFEDFYFDFGDLYFARKQHRRRSEKFHREIYEAIANQNAGHAREIMHAALLYAEKAVMTEILKRGPTREPNPNMG